MITEANVKNLMRCVRNNEGANKFDLRCFRSQCGTYGCLVGNDAHALGMAAKDVHINFGTHYDWGSREYGVECGDRMLTVWEFLFGFYKRTEFATKEDCLRRLRKFIYYVLHKRELLYDDSGRIRETARRAEGNHNVLAQVKAKVERACHDEPAYLAPDVAERAVFPQSMSYEAGVQRT